MAVTGAAINSAKEDKDPLERYYTTCADADKVWKILRALGLVGRSFPLTNIFDPCGGADVFVSAAPEHNLSVTLDLDPDADADYPGMDYLGALPHTLVRALHRTTHVVTNPPFSRAAEFLEKTRQLCPDAVIAFLLPMSYLGSQERERTVHRTLRPTHLVHMGRLKFDGPAMAGKKKKNGAMQDYVLACWEPGVKPGECLFYWKGHLLVDAPLFGHALGAK